MYLHIYMKTLQKALFKSAGVMNYMFSPMPWLGYREAPSDGSLIKADGEHGSCGLSVLCLYGSPLTGYDHA